MSIPILPTPASGLARFLKHDILVALVIAVVLSGATFALAYSVGWLSGAPNWFEVAAATLNYGATYLSIKQRRFAYTLGFVASAFWAVAYYQYNLLGSALLSLYLVGQLIYGYFRWGPDGSTRPVHKFKWANWWMYALATGATFGGAYLLITALGGSFAPLDATILVLTILAQFLLDNKVIASWYVWMLVNIVGVTLYATAGAPFAAVQQVIFGLANIWGYVAWRNSMQKTGQNFSEEAISKMQPKEEIGLMFTPVTVDESPLMKRIVTNQQYSGDSKVDATFHPSETFIIATGDKPKVSQATTEIDQVKLDKGDGVA